MQKKTEKEGKTMRWVKQKTHSKKDLKLVISIIELNINGLNQRSANFFYKGPISKYFWYLDRTVSVATIPLCPCSLKAATDDMQMNGHG